MVLSEAGFFVFPVFIFLPLFVCFLSKGNIGIRKSIIKKHGNISHTMIEIKLAEAEVNK